MTEEEEKSERRKGVAELRHDEQMSGLHAIVAKLEEVATELREESPDANLLAPRAPLSDPTLAHAGHLYDAPRLGRKLLKRYTIAGLILATPALAQRLRKVPAGAISEETEEPTALIECPCGHRPVAERSLAKCPGCERIYVTFGPGRTYVVYGDMEMPERRVRSTSSD